MEPTFAEKNCTNRTINELLLQEITVKAFHQILTDRETDITEFDEALVRKLIGQIAVFADHFTVEFKSGITIIIEV